MSALYICIICRKLYFLYRLLQNACLSEDPEQKKTGYATYSVCSYIYNRIMSIIGSQIYNSVSMTQNTLIGSLHDNTEALMSNIYTLCGNAAWKPESIMESIPNGEKMPITSIFPRLSLDLPSVLPNLPKALILTSCWPHMSCFEAPWAHNEVLYILGYIKVIRICLV